MGFLTILGYVFVGALILEQLFLRGAEEIEPKEYKEMDEGKEYDSWYR